VRTENSELAQYSRAGRTMWRLTMSRELGFWQVVIVVAIIASALAMIVLQRDRDGGER
jgi:hypothetical protein